MTLEESKKVILRQEITIPIREEDKFNYLPETQP